MGHLRSFGRIPIVFIRREEENFLEVGQKSGHAQEISGVECGEWHEFYQMFFFETSFTHHHDYEECVEIEKHSDDISYCEDFHNSVGVLYNKEYEIDYPDEIEYEIVKDALEV